MDARVWQRYAAVACGHAWQLDVHDTEEVLRCIEALLAAPIAGQVTVQVLLRDGVGKLTAERRGSEVRIRIHTQGRAAGDLAGGSPNRLGKTGLAAPLHGLPLPWEEEPVNRSWQSYVASLCSDAWGMTRPRSDKIIERIEFLVATDQLSDVTVADALASFGLDDPMVGEAARSIHTTIGAARRTA